MRNYPLHKHVWSGEEKAVIRGAYFAGVAVSETMETIAQRISPRLSAPLTKNAIISLAHRNGWAAQAKPDPAKVERGATVRPRTCQWVHGEPADRNFCGDPVHPGMPYCERHGRVAYTYHWALPPKEVTT